MPSQLPAHRDQLWNVLLLYALSTFTTSSEGALLLVFPLHLDRLGHPLPLVGLTVALIAVGSLISRLPGGAWYRLSRGRLLTAGGMALMALTTAAFGLTNQWLLQAVLAAAHGFAFGLATTFVLALLIEVRPRDANPASVMAWYTAAISLGYATGGPLGAWSIERFGHEPSFFVAAVVSLAGAVLALALRPPRAVPSAAGGAARGAASGFSLRGIASLPSGVWLATLLVFYVNFVADSYNTFHPIYALSLGIPLATLGLLKSVHGITSTVVRFASAGLFRYVSLQVVNHVIVITMAVGTAALAFVTQVAPLTLLYAVLGMCRGLLRVTSATMLAEERRHHELNVGLTSGVYNSGLDLGSMLGPPAVGALAGAFGIPTTFCVVAVTLPSLYYAIWFAQRARAARPAAIAARQS